MKPANIRLIKTELEHLETSELVDICLRLGKFKTENKELLSYLIFHSKDETAFCIDVKWEIDQLFQSANKSSVFLFKKTVRKVLRYVNRCSRISGHKSTDIELRIHFLQGLNGFRSDLNFTRVLSNLYLRQLERCVKHVSNLHEDLQGDYDTELETLKLPTT